MVPLTFAYAHSRVCAELLSEPGTGWFGAASAETSHRGRMWLLILQQAGLVVEDPGRAPRKNSHVRDLLSSCAGLRSGTAASPVGHSIS